MNQDDLSDEWTETLCARAVVDDYLGSALLMIRELHHSITEGRPVDPLYSALLAQMLTAADFCAVHGILISASARSSGVTR